MLSEAVMVKVTPGALVDRHPDPICITVSDPTDPKRKFFKVEVSRFRLLRALKLTGEAPSSMMGALVR